MKREYDYALAHDTPTTIQFRDLAHLYAKHPDQPTLALLYAAAEDVRKEMSNNDYRN